MQIKEYNSQTHLSRVRECFVELQDFERRHHPGLPAGADIVDLYIPHMLERCEHCQGKVLVAEIGGEVAGYVTSLTKVKSEDLEDGDAEYGLVSDLVVAQEFRRRGIGRKLLEAAESFARTEEASSLRIGVLAGNQIAEDLYSSMGYALLYTELEKDLNVAEMRG